MNFLSEIASIFKKDKITISDGEKIIDKISDSKIPNLILKKFEKFNELEKKTLLVYSIESGKIEFTILFQEKYNILSNTIPFKRFLEGLMKNDFIYIKKNPEEILKYLNLSKNPEEILNFLIWNGLFEIAYYFSFENNLTKIDNEILFKNGISNFEKNYKNINFNLNNELSKLKIYLEQISFNSNTYFLEIKQILEKNNNDFKSNIYNLTLYQKKLISELNEITEDIRKNFKKKYILRLDLQINYKNKNFEKIKEEIGKQLNIIRIIENITVNKFIFILYDKHNNYKKLLLLNNSNWNEKMDEDQDFIERFTTAEDFYNSSLKLFEKRYNLNKIDNFTPFQIFIFKNNGGTKPINNPSFEIQNLKVA